MKCTVYRSLDKPTVFFGIRGRFIRIFGIIAAIGGVVSIVLGSIIDSIVGFILFAGVAVVDYFFVLSIQGKSSDREYNIRKSSKNLVSCFQFPRMSLRHVWRGDRFIVS